MRTLSKVQNWVFRIGAMLMVVGAATFLFGNWFSAVTYVLGVLMFVWMQLQTTYEGTELTMLRLRRQQLFGAFLFVLSAIAMVYQMMGHNVVRYNEWVVCLLVGAVIEFYTAFRIPQELNRRRVKE
ncbi:MAG: hypothetical protein IJ762_09695 [Bacteroidaceae bacterium]|nr:hypothetical protein [Bacteroidaceae bacterium]